MSTSDTITMSTSDHSEGHTNALSWNFYHTTFYPKEDDSSEPFSKRKLVTRGSDLYTFSKFTIDVEREVLDGITLKNKKDGSEVVMGPDDMWRLNYQKLKLRCKKKNIPRKYYRENGSYKLQKYILGTHRFSIDQSDAIRTAGKYCKDSAAMKDIRENFEAKVHSVQVNAEGCDDLDERIKRMEKDGYYSGDYADGKVKRKKKHKVSGGTGADHKHTST